jgi:CheY-like chemotaxis protein
MIGNLLTNAAKYTPAGGRIEVSAERDNGHAVVRVTDTGIGIPADMVPRVFDLFTQVEAHRDRAQGGLGIGLALVRKLVELHGGAATAESPGPDLGSTFVIRLPLAAGSPVRPVAESDPDRPARGRSRRVLVVDDNADAADSLSELLALSGHETATARSGPDALDRAARFRPELVFLDIGLPGMSGYEVARTLRADPTCGEAVLVALTGWGSEEDRRKSAEAGFDFHLVKPVETGQIAGLLAKLPDSGV